jgi:phosphoribosylcarboxyaminoimidazole (NCAIR) mutase
LGTGLENVFGAEASVADSVVSDVATVYGQAIGAHQAEEAHHQAVTAAGIVAVREDQFWNAIAYLAKRLGGVIAAEAHHVFHEFFPVHVSRLTLASCHRGPTFFVQKIENASGGDEGVLFGHAGFRGLCEDAWHLGA